MSVVTNMIFVHPVQSDPQTLDLLNSWLREHEAFGGQQFETLDTRHAGGNKYFECEVAACAGNYLPYYDLLQALENGELRLSDSPCFLYVQTQEDDQFVWSNARLLNGSFE